MIPVLEGKVPVVIRPMKPSRIQAAVAWAERESLRIIIAGGHDA